MNGASFIWRLIWLSVLIALLQPTTIFTQNLDSLLSIVDGQEGKVRAQTLLEIAFLRDSEEDYQKAYYYAKTDNLADQHSRAATAYAYYLWGEKGMAEAGLKLVREAESVAIAHRDTIAWVDALLLESGITLALKDYHLAIQTAAKSLQLGKSVKDTFSIIASHLALADGYSNFSGNQTKAKNHLLRASKYLDRPDDYENRYKIFNDLGSYYAVAEKKDSALLYYQRALEVGRMYLHPENLAIVLTNIGLVYSEVDSLDAAIALVDSAYKLNLAARDTSGLSFDHYVFSKIEEKKGNTNGAIRHAHLARDYARATMYDFDLLNAYERLHEVYQTVGDVDHHMLYLKSFHSLKDSIQLKERRVFNQNFESRLAAERKNAEILKLNQQAWKDQRMKWVLWVALVALILLGFLIYKNLSHRTKAQKARLKQLQAERKAHRLELENAVAKKEFHEQQIKVKERELASKMTKSIQQHDLLKEVLDKLKRLSDRFTEKDGEEISSLIKKIERENQLSDSWPDLVLHFEKSRPQFFERIKEKGIQLTTNEERLCVYAFMRLDTSSISQLMGINNESVNKARYRLRKKFGLKKDEKFEDYVSGLMQG